MHRFVLLVVVTWFAMACSSGPAQVVTGAPTSTPGTSAASTSTIPAIVPTATTVVAAPDSSFDPDDTVVIGADQGIIRITELQTDCCYFEGSCGVLEVIDAEGETVGEPIPLPGRAAVGDVNDGEPFLGVYPDVPVLGGEYIIEVTQFDSEGFCEDEAAGPRRAHHICGTVVRLGPGEIVDLAVSWSIENGCGEFGPPAEILPEGI